MNPPNGAQELVVIGASAGGITPLKRILSELPQDYPSIVFVVMHLPANSPRYLIDILSTNCRLTVNWATDRLLPAEAAVYVALPDRHLLIKKGRMQISNGPRENHAKPSIDVTLRSAARAYGSRVTAIILSGALNDGTYGAMMVKTHGGKVIIQDPLEAENPSMPQSVAEHTEVDAVLRSEKIGDTLVNLAARPNGASTTSSQLSHPDEIETMSTPDNPPDGTLVSYVCPDCGGSLWMSQEGSYVRFQCHTGHVFSSDVLLSEQSEELESALWSAVRVINEHVSMLKRIGSAESKAGSIETSNRHFRKEDELQEQGRLIREMLLSPR